MLNFLKRNAKFVVTLGVSLLIVAGLSTALIVTNVGSASARGRDRDRERPVLTEEQIAERVESIRERLEQRLADERITQEEFDEKIAALESGEYPIGRGGGRHGRIRGERNLNREDKPDKGDRDFSDKQDD